MGTTTHYQTPTPPTRGERAQGRYILQLRMVVMFGSLAACKSETLYVVQLRSRRRRACTKQCSVTRLRSSVT